jgi:hypothetical protein
MATRYVSGPTGLTEEDWELEEFYGTVTFKITTKEHIVEEVEVSFYELLFRVLPSV